jgi:hypothetical protein
MTPDSVAAMCPRDGETRCTGALSGWIWATADQVEDLMGLYAPAILAADPPSVGGPEYLLPASEFIADTCVSGETRRSSCEA